MTRSSKQLLLEDEIDVLVKHFGIHRVRAAVAKISPKDEGAHASSQKVPRGRRTPSTNVFSGLEAIRESAPEKHRLLSEFLERLKYRSILPESQDIRHFAQLVGLKEISAKSRKEMIPKLMHFLLEQPVERLRTDIQSAANISEQERQKGFSLLTDKLLRKS